MRCEPQAEGPYGEFARRSLAVALRDRIPISGTIEITARCNLSCSHCYIPREVPDHRDLSTDQWFRILEQLAEAGCLWLGITGGEPLLRSDFRSIYKRARKLGFLITLLTNGTLLDEETIDLLASEPPLMVETSIYGASAETYERVTGSPNAFREVVSAIENLVARKIRLTLKTTVTRKNVGDIGTIERMALDLGVPFRFDGLINSRLDGDRAPLAERLDPDVLAELEMNSPDKRASWKVVQQHQELTRTADDTIFACGAGRSTFHVNYLGELSPCIMARHPAHPLTTRSFKSGWESALFDAVFAPAKPDSVCTSCAIAPMCSTCAGWGLWEHGAPEAVEGYLCDVAKARVQRMSGLKIERHTARTRHG